MKAAVLTAGNGKGMKVAVVDMAVPKAARGELVVEMKACGLCGTDVEKIRGEYTASKPVIGHEAVGVVKEVGAGVGSFRVGDRVFPHHHVPDYTCYLCRAGNETMCEHYRSSNLSPGGFSESFLVPGWNLEKGGVLKLPDTMTFEVASLIEPLACCVRAMRKSKAESAGSVLVAGAGPVGMMHALLLRKAGPKVMISDVNQTRLSFAERASAGAPLDATKDVPGSVRGLTEGRGADVAIVASGSKAAIIQCLRSVRKGGKVVLFGVPARGSVLDYDFADLYNSELEVVTSYGATENDTREAMGILESRGPEFRSLITHSFPLTRFGDALQAATEGEAMKVVVTP